MKTTSLEAAVKTALQSVMDPEIPVVSVLDMGMIKEIDIDGDSARIVVLPTFVGCPAVGVIKEDVARAVRAVVGIDRVVVETSFSPPWTSARITPEGRRKLKDFGLAPPTGHGPVLISDIGLPATATCPFCGSSRTHSESLFGPTPCRAVFYCKDCRNPFEQFKPV
ncbi:MAG: phenylacetate-CoA oxygenase subunit PaaJ [Actinomycetota bacterium]|nr:phenylacetate-CoA oxygenase subunit PaaJ [Actinomycetota bacterium]